MGRRVGPPTRRLILLLVLLSALPSGAQYQTVTVTLKLGDDTVASTQLGNISAMSSHIPPPFSPTGYFRVMVDPNWFAERYLKVDEHTSALSVRTNIDRDEVCRQLDCCRRLLCETKFVVFIRMTSTRSIKVNVIVLFKDENDNAPIIDTNFLPLPESTTVGSTTPLPLATDKDSAVNGVIRYRLSDPSGTFFFYTDSSGRPMLRLMKRLDADDRNRRAYALTYSAVDGGDPPKTGRVTLQVRVVDENDNAPVFRDGSRTEWISEAEPVGTEVHRFFATDADVDEDNRRVSFHLNQEASRPKGVATQRFAVDAVSGSVTIRSPLDYDTPEERNFKLVLEARDHGSPSLTATATLSVILTNVNDNDPRITVTQTLQLMEEKPKNQRVRTISIRDPDEISSINVNCSLKNNDGFKIKAITENHYFDIVTTRVFDHEVQAEVTLTVACTDKSPPERTVYRTLQIPVVDINDHSPVFAPATYSTRLAENARINQEVLTVRATDRDSGPRGEVRYSLDKTGQRFFRIDRLRGIIYVNSTLDREKISTLIFSVNAEDTGNPSRAVSTRVLVELTDVNDNSPVFASPRSVDVSENAPPGTVVTRVSFFDPDEGDNGEVKFKLVRDKNLALRYLNMTPKGQVVVIKPIDRETITRMYLDIWAYDLGSPPRETTAALIVRVLDVNDQRPRLISPGEHATLGFSPPLFTDSPFNSTVVTLVAEDGDLGENGTVTFEIAESNATGLFQLDAASGRLYSVWEPSNPPNHGVYRLQVRFSDQGRPQLSSEAELFVVVSPQSAGGIGRNRVVSNIVILILILVCSVAIATLLIIGILWARARGKRSRGSVAERAAQYLGYDPAVKKGMTVDVADTDSELVSNAELVTRMAPEPLTDNASCSTLTPAKRTPCRLSQASADFAMACPAATSSLRRSRSPGGCVEGIHCNQFRTLGPHSSLGASFAMENFASLGRHHSSTSPLKQRPMAMVSAHLLSEVYEDDPRQSDLSYEDSGKGGSVEDLNRFMLGQHNNNSSTSTTGASVHLPVTSRVSLRPSPSSQPNASSGRETLC